MLAGFITIVFNLTCHQRVHFFVPLLHHSDIHCFLKLPKHAKKMLAKVWIKTGRKKITEMIKTQKPT